MENALSYFTRNHRFVVPGQRLAMLDALRGIAAVSVMFFHFYLYSNIRPILLHHIPSGLDASLLYGYHGINIFFVLSGFVISLSLIEKPAHVRVYGDFMMRRSVRLDIPYYAVLIFATVLLAISGRSPSIGQFISHLFYVQNIFGYKNIVSQFWTLCYELQFYIFFCLSIFLFTKSQFLGRWNVLIWIIPFVVSAILSINHITTHGWFIDKWDEFFLGILTMALLTGRVPLGIWSIIIAVSMTIGICFHSNDTIVSVSTALLIGAVGVLGCMTKFSGGPILQWLGKISYSLYLIHFMGDVFTKWYVHPESSLGTAYMSFVIASLLSVGLAAGFYYAVEGPSHRLSRYLIPMESKKSWHLEKNVA